MNNAWHWLFISEHTAGNRYVLEDGEADKSGTKENEEEESDCLKDCNKMLQSMTNFNYEHTPDQPVTGHKR